MSHIISNIRLSTLVGAYILSMCTILADNLSPFRSRCRENYSQILDVCINHSDIIPLTGLGPIYALSIDATIYQPREASFVRIVLEDNNGHDYLVAESCWYRNDTTIVEYHDYCEETARLPGVVPCCLKCFISEDAIINISSVNASTTPLLMRADSESIDSLKYLQVQSIADRINHYNQKHGKPWVAGVTKAALAAYDESPFKGESGTYSTSFAYLTYGFFEFGERNEYSGPHSTEYIDSFDWRYRHGRSDNYWITPVKDQDTTDLCQTFAAVGLMECMANLYFNKNLNLDLSEEDVAIYMQQIYPNDTLKWHHELTVLGTMCNNGVIDETSLPFSNQTYPPTSGTRPEGIEKISSTPTISSTNPINENKVVNAIISRPSISGFTENHSAHEMLLVGYGKITQEMCNALPHFSLYPPIDSLVNRTYLIFKNSWGESWNGGYAFVVFNNYKKYMRDIYSLPGKIYSKNHSDDDILCEDCDGDGLFNWGIGPVPPTLPSWAPQIKDGDDSNSDAGMMSNKGRLAVINPDSIATLHILNDTTICYNSYIPNHIIVENSVTLTITANVVTNRTTEVCLKPGAVMHINGGSIRNAWIRPEYGSKIILDGGGNIVSLHNRPFELPLGALLELNQGAIE